MPLGGTPVRRKRVGVFVRPAVRWPTKPLVGAAGFFAVLVGLVVAGHVPLLLAGAYPVLSLIAMEMYRADKAAALTGAWRISEATLHAVALAGGWPGALVARRVYR